MTDSTKLIISIVVTYLMTRGVFYLTGFNPTRDLKALPGYTLDILIWVIAMVATRWILDKCFKAPNSSAT